MRNETTPEATPQENQERALLIEHVRALVTHHTPAQLAYCVQIWFITFAKHGDTTAHPPHLNDMSCYERLHAFLCNLDRLDLYEVQK